MVETGSRGFRNERVARIESALGLLMEEKGRNGLVDMEHARSLGKACDVDVGVVLERWRALGGLAPLADMEGE